MADKTVRGRFVWHELMTPDSTAAHAFYTKVLGWKTQPWAQDPAYTMFAAASGPLGGTVAQSTGTPGWIHYVGTTDLPASLEQAKSLGASVTKGITSIGGGAGSYAVLTDPQGATFAMYASDADQGGREKPAKRGEFSWHELVTTDPQAALKFYGALFGWEKAGEHDMGPMGSYYLFGRNGNPLGGMFKMAAGMPGGPAWLGYVRVKDVNKVVNKVKSAGGKLVNGPMEVPGGDWIAQFSDPQGAMFAVHTVKADLESAAAQPAEPAAAPPAPAPAEKAASARKSAPAAKKAAKKKKAAARKKPAAKKRRGAAKSVQRPARKAAKVRRQAPKKKRTAGKKKSSRKAVRKVGKTAGRKARKGK